MATQAIPMLQQAWRDEQLDEGSGIPPGLMEGVIEGSLLRALAVRGRGDEGVKRLEAAALQHEDGGDVAGGFAHVV